MIRKWLDGAASVALLATAACHGPNFADSGPAPSPYVEQPEFKPYAESPPPPPPETVYSQPLGPVDRGAGLLGGPDDKSPPPPKSYDQPETVILMAPIPNPEDLSPAERERVYGPGERARAELAGGPSDPGGGKWAPAPGASASSPPQSPAQVAAARPSATPRPATRTPGRSTASAPARPAAPAPAPKAAATAQTPAERLGAALADELSAGASLNIPDAVAQGGAGIVTLNLPANFATRLREEAAKVGLAAAARTADVTATLAGDGFEIVPNDTQSARLADGQSTGLSWDVRASEEPGASLTATVGAALKGAGQPQAVEITSIEKAVGPEAEATDAASGPKLSQKWVGWGLLGLLAVLVLGLFGRSHSRKRTEDRERRRREREEFVQNAETKAHPES